MTIAETRVRIQSSHSMPERQTAWTFWMTRVFIAGFATTFLVLGYYHIYIHESGG